jgi:hypothetical protein
MRFILYANDEPVGRAEMVGFDPSMGGASGPFRPNENYLKVRPIIREFLKCDGSLGRRNDHELRKCQKKLDALHLQLRDETGRVLNTANIYLVDFSEELGEDEGYELQRFSKWMSHSEAKGLRLQVTGFRKNYLMPEA